MDEEDETNAARLARAYAEAMEGLRQQALSSWRTSLQMIAEVRDLKKIVEDERELRVQRQGEVDAQLQKIREEAREQTATIMKRLGAQDRTLEHQNRILTWVRRAAVAAAVLAGAAFLVYAGAVWF